MLDRAAVQEIEAALRNKQAASALAKVVTGERTVLLKDGLECHAAAV